MRAQILKWLAALLIAGAALGVAWWHGWHTRGDEIERKASDQVLADARQALARFASESARLNGLAGKIQQQADRLASQTATRIVEYRTHEKLVPLPADCRIDAGRLQQLQAGVDAANAAIVAAQPGGQFAGDRTAGD
ncbi:hypothetical protein [Crenobacter cavernae]|nr:hypothetical protein [Crenobacter cavernae]